MKSNPTERPILFSGEMVRAILAGRKSQTRRVITEAYTSRRKDGCKLVPELLQKMGAPGHSCPFGVPGTRLWVRETWTTSECGIHYRASCDEAEDDLRKDLGIRWHPSIFMPRKFSRLTLEVTKVRVERVQDITEHDALEEGCDITTDVQYAYHEDEDVCRQWYAKLWDSINAKNYPWSSNPWVWVIEFRRVQ